MKKKILLILLIFIATSIPATAFAATSYTYEGYTYDWWWNAVEGPSSFQLERVVDESNMEGVKVQGLNDVCTSEDGRIFLVDTLESRVDIMDQSGTLIKSIKVIRDAKDKIVIDDTGAQVLLNAPEGVFYQEDQGELYIADTGAGRILVLDGSNYSLLRIIGRPDNMEGVTEFKPSKIVVDYADRIYVVVQSSYEGIIELNADGSFSRYFGVNTPSVNLLDYFWKSISTDKQKEQMAKTFAPAFNNIGLDADGFVYSVTYDASSTYKVFRFNSAGINILREEGNTLVEGDPYSKTENSRFVDIAVSSYGTYAVLDKTMGRIFVYDYDGQLLSAFGNSGKTKGAFQIPTGIAWLGNKLVVTDSSLKRAYILEPTDFGEAALLASEKYYYGQWDEALVLNEEILKLNSNYEIAYTGIGKNYLMKGEFKKAMYYFKLGNNRTFYSKAFSGYRGEVLKDNFAIVAVIFLLLLSMVVISEVRYHKKEGKKS